MRSLSNFNFPLSVSVAPFHKPQKLTRNNKELNKGDVWQFAVNG